MSHCSDASAVNDETFFGRTDLGADITEQISSQERDLLSQQAGQILIEMGSLFLTTPLNEHVDQKTGDLLISIGRKLQLRK